MERFCDSDPAFPWKVLVVFLPVYDPIAFGIYVAARSIRIGQKTAVVPKLSHRLPNCVLQCQPSKCEVFAPAGELWR
jgi:hypothetical protein